MGEIKKFCKLLMVQGPTATGKSDLAVRLCNILGGEVISADSMQVYRGMDIGTAKIRPEEMQGVPHHMLDICSPMESFSVAAWVEQAQEAIEEIVSRGHVPVVVGGTGLYMDSLLSARRFASASDDGALREQLSAQYDAEGGEAFRAKVCAVDPERGEKLHPADKKRLVRALEVYMLTGHTLTWHDQESQKVPPAYDSLRIALNYASREVLYRHIEERVERMFSQGLVQEVQSLLEQGLTAQHTAMQAIGYKEVVQYLQGDWDEATMREEIKKGTRRYAKRQLTWLKRDADLHWILWDELPDIDRAVQETLALWQGSEKAHTRM